MKCPRCQQENPPQAKFCLECATALALRCTNCGIQLPAGAKFCFECATPVGGSALAPRFASPETYTPKHLAERIINSKTALEGERKQVTVLFADLKGSMELLADRDPEEARKILDPVLELMMEAVHRYEGTVNQVMGDGIMALFGAPVAHEDHAVRACYAAIHMQDTVRGYAEEVFHSHGTVLQIRVGLNSGEVVVRSIGSDLRMDYTAVGQTTHVAARMEQLASPGSTVLSPATLELVEGHVEVKPRGPVAIKGLTAPMGVFELAGASGVRSRFQAAAGRGLTRFVGRTAEMEQLLRAMTAARDGHGQVVAVVGDAGVGKSRLFWELTRSHRVQSASAAGGAGALESWRVVEAGAVSYGKTAPYLPVVELLRGYFAIERRDDARSIREKVTGKVLALDRALEPTLPALMALLDIPSDDVEWGGLEPLQRRARTMDAVKRLLLRESQVQPLLVIVEDLHWMDAESQALLDTLVESVATARVLLLFNYRPEYRHGWSGRSYYRQLRVEPLPPENAEDLLDGVLGTGPGLGPLRRLLIARTEGNPFFLEESVRSLVETRALIGERGMYQLAGPLGSLRIPASVQAILAARIDRLAPDDKRLLQAASVIGKDVPWALLEAIDDMPEDQLRPGLARLQAAELLLEARLFPDLEYTFKHALTHDVAYESLLHDRRRGLHAAVVTAIEHLHAGRLAEHVERLAHHAGRGEIWDKAAPYLRETGRKAFARSANREAADYFEDAAATFDRLPSTRETVEQAIDVRFELRTALQVARAFDRQKTCLDDATRLAETLGDQRRLGYALMFAGLRATLSEDCAEGFRLGQRALAIGEALGDLGIHAGASCYLGITHIIVGRFNEAARFAEAAIALIPPARLYERFGQARLAGNLARAIAALAFGSQGQFPDALTRMKEALEIATVADHTYSLSSTAFELGALRLMKGDHEQAARDFEQSIEVWQRLQATAWGAPVRGLALAYCRMGRVAEGLGLMKTAQAGQGDFSGHFQLSVGLALGEAYLLAGRLDEAAVQVDQTLNLVRQKGQRAFEAAGRHLVGEIAARAEPCDAAAAERSYGTALSLAEELGMRPLGAHCHLGLGKLYRYTGKRQEAQRHLATATTMYREMDMRFWLERAEAELK
jgi:class 3 adenylate cyclase/tetratricopeptide (TPR) repeat protein